jgi:hypothetical protein
MALANRRAGTLAGSRTSDERLAHDPVVGGHRTAGFPSGRCQLRVDRVASRRARHLRHVRYAPDSDPIGAATYRRDVPGADIRVARI